MKWNLRGLLNITACSHILWIEKKLLLGTFNVQAYAVLILLESTDLLFILTVNIRKQI